MAIDNAEKRKCVAGIPFWPMSPSVTPNASKDQEWRQEAGHGYCGILADSPAAVTQSLSRGLYDWKRGLYHGEYTPTS